MKIAYMLLILAVCNLMHAGVFGFDFAAFKARFGKKYATVAEEIKRKAIFDFNWAKVLVLNKTSWNDNEDTIWDVNEFDDQTEDEFTSNLLGLAGASDLMASGKSVANSKIVTASGGGYLDWQDKGVVTAVKNQGSCGSCYVFSAVAIVESYYARKNPGKLLSFSEQQLLDCPKRSDPCGGGYPNKVLAYMKTNGAYRSDYNTYKAKGGTCKEKASSVVTKIGGYAGVAKKTDVQEIMNTLKNYGPMVMCLNASPLRHYTKGVLRASKCKPGSGPNHAVTLVGYGTSGGIDYWRIKNSWGTSWGEKGYFRLERNKNTCDIYNPNTGYGPWYISS